MSPCSDKLMIETDFLDPKHLEVLVEVKFATCFELTFSISHVTWLDMD